MTASRWYYGLTAALTCAVAMAQEPGSAPPAGGGPPPGAGNGGPPAEIVAVFKTCDADIKTHCAGKEGPEAMMCLLSSKEKVSAECRDALSKLPPPPQGGGGPPPGGAPPADKPPQK